MRCFDSFACFGMPTVPGLRYARRAEDLLAVMDRLGIARALVRHEVLRTEDPAVVRDLVLAECDSPRLLPTWPLAPRQTRESADPLPFLDQMAEAGVRALWALPTTQRYLLDGVTFGPLLEALSERGVPLFVPLDEVGGTDAGWAPLAALLRDFPQLTLVATGHGCWGCDRYFRPLVEAYPRFHLDTSRFELDQGIADFVASYGSDRLLFATGYPHIAPGGPLGALLRAPIAESDREAIAGGNLERLLSWATPLPQLEGDLQAEDDAGLSMPIVDCHAHFGPYARIWFPTRTAEDMLRTMDRSNVRVAVCSHHTALTGDTPLGNRLLLEEGVAPHPERFLGYTAWNPHLADEQAADLASWPPHPGFVGFKLHPSIHGVAMTDARYAPVLEYADAHRLPVLSHTWGGSGVDGPGPVHAVLERWPNLQLLLGHSLFGEWDAATRIAREFPNVWLELCAAYAIAGVVEKFVDEVGSERVLYGTDLPWFDPVYPAGCVSYAAIGEEDKRNILHRNAMRLFPSCAARIE